MKVIHALNSLTASIFLAGPTPRTPNTVSWRKEALEHLRNYGFPGEVFVPELDNWLAHENYDSQINWEWEALNRATRIAFWIPRELEHMPAFTTNVEYGMCISSGKCLLGYPVDAPKMKYLDKLAVRFNTPVYNSLPELMNAAAWEAEETMRLITAL